MNSSVATLYNEAERLDNRSLDAFISNILSLRIQRNVSDEQKREVVLLKKINKSLSIEQMNRFRELNEKYADNNITENEYAELGVFVEKIEKLNVTRLKYLIELAQLRKTTVKQLMIQLGISNPNNA
jgi:Rad3-related DNA helicase